MHHGVAGVTGVADLRAAVRMLMLCHGVRRLANHVPQRSRSGDSRQAKAGEMCVSRRVEAAASDEVNVDTRHSAVVHGAHDNAKVPVR